jgi:hypothetical protein
VIQAFDFATQSRKGPDKDDSGFGTKLWGGNLGNEFCRDAYCQRLFGATVHKPRLSN